ncbi:hypothetical protein YC2023_065148 [Brassica napus]
MERKRSKINGEEESSIKLPVMVFPSMSYLLIIIHLRKITKRYNMERKITKINGEEESPIKLPVMQYNISLKLENSITENVWDPIAIIPRNVSTIPNGRPLVSLGQFNSTEVEIPASANPVLNNQLGIPKLSIKNLRHRKKILKALSRKLRQQHPLRKRLLSQTSAVIKVGENTVRRESGVELLNFSDCFPGFEQGQYGYIISKARETVKREECYTISLKSFRIRCLTLVMYIMNPLRKWNERWVIFDPTTGKMEYK